MTPAFLPDNCFDGAPGLPHDRPPTRAEVWAHFSHVYRSGVKSGDELRDYCKARYVDGYAYWHGIYQWRKQPDWMPGDPVIPAAVPASLGPDQPRTRIVYECLQIARAAA